MQDISQYLKEIDLLRSQCEAVAKTYPDAKILEDRNTNVIHFFSDMVLSDQNSFLEFYTNHTLSIKVTRSITYLNPINNLIEEVFVSQKFTNDSWFSQFGDKLPIIECRSFSLLGDSDELLYEFNNFCYENNIYIPERFLKNIESNMIEWLIEQSKFSKVKIIWSTFPDTISDKIKGYLNFS